MLLSSWYRSPEEVFAASPHPGELVGAHMLVALTCVPKLGQGAFYSFRCLWAGAASPRPPLLPASPSALVPSCWRPGPADPAWVEDEKGAEGSPDPNLLGILVSRVPGAPSASALGQLSHIHHLPTVLVTPDIQ